MYNINTFVDKIFFINLDKDIDRYNYIIDSFQKHNITNYEKISGVLVNREDTINWKFMGPFNKKLDPEKYRIGSLGCLLAHQKTILLAKKRGYKKILILEDDILFPNNFNELFNDFITAFRKTGITYWNILYLGLCNWRDTSANKYLSDDIIKIKGGGYCAHAYIINSNIFDYILENIDYSKMEIDLLYNSLNIQCAIRSYTYKERVIKHKHNNNSNTRKLTEFN